MPDVQYSDAISCARGLLCETIQDPEHEGHPEYTRGIVNLIAEMFGKFGMPTGERMDEVARDLGLHISYH
jgi:hypothetical protein